MVFAERTQYVDTIRKMNQRASVPSRVMMEILLYVAVSQNDKLQCKTLTQNISKTVMVMGNSFTFQNVQLEMEFRVTV